jgi:hypothetical protein
LEIVDYKTGTITDANGELKSEYVLQLQAYALMAQEQTSESAIRLYVDNGDETAVPSDAKSLTAARDHIREFVERFPSGALLSPGELADPGADCRWCRIRPTCPAYRTEAPSWWRDIPNRIDIEPWDTWGEVTSVSRTADNAVTVDLLDAASRAVRVRRLDTRHGIDDRSIGTMVYIFDLVADSLRRGFTGERPHPRLFHELPDSNDASTRAWTIQVYLESI